MRGSSSACDASSVKAAHWSGAFEKPAETSTRFLDFHRRLHHDSPGADAAPVMARPLRARPIKLSSSTPRRFRHA